VVRSDIYGSARLFDLHGSRATTRRPAELQQLHKKGHDASSVVAILNPAVEALILAVSRAIRGRRVRRSASRRHCRGESDRRALAAGETPSPEMVAAAAPPARSIRPSVCRPGFCRDSACWPGRRVRRQLLWRASARQVDRRAPGSARRIG